MGGEKNNEEEEDDGVVVDDDDDDDDATLPRTTEKKESKGGGDGGGVRAGAARGGRGDFGTVYNDDEYDDDDDDDDDDEKPPPVFGTGRSGALLQDEKRGDVLRREEPEKGERTENAVRSQRRIRKLSRPKSIEPASGAADAAVRKPGKKRKACRLLDVDVLSWRGNVTKLLCAPWESREGFRLECELVRRKVEEEEDDDATNSVDGRSPGDSARAKREASKTKPLEETMRKTRTT